MGRRVVFSPAGKTPHTGGPGRVPVRNLCGYTVAYRRIPSHTFPSFKPLAPFFSFFPHFRRHGSKATEGMRRYATASSIFFPI